jgi:hypothetical protein
MSDQDLQGLVQHLKDWLGQRMWMPDEMPVSVPCNAAAADLTVGEVRAAVEGLSAKRGTCSTCRFAEYPPNFGRPQIQWLHCMNPDAPEVRTKDGPSLIRHEQAKTWGCTLYEPQPTATEEASHAKD